MQRINDTPFETLYEIEEDRIGSGQFAIVKRVRQRQTNKVFAAKFVKKRRYPNSRRGVLKSHILREIEILKLLGGHANIVDLIEVFENPTEIILILELVSGGELFDYVYANEFLPESDAAIFTYQILKALQHCHRKNVAHLDIKPENIMLKSKSEKSIKLIDFGLSRQINPGVCIREMIGTPEFVAPEIINYEPLSLSVDLWALGVVCYILLSGTSPFLGSKGREQTFYNITSVTYHFTAIFSRVSNEAKDFITRLLVRDVQKRATVEECLNHPWILRFNVAQITNSPSLSPNQANQSHNKSARFRWKRAMEASIHCLRYTRKYRQSNYFIQHDTFGSSILLACEKGNLPVLKQLISMYRINPTLVSNDLGETPLHVAAGNGYEEIIALLLKFGCDPRWNDIQDESPIFWAARNGHTHVIKQLLKSTKIKNSSEDYPTAVCSIVNRINKSKESALHVATRYAQIQTVICLLEYGADINFQDNHGETCMHLAAWDGNSSLLGILCRFSPEMNILNQVIIIS